MKKLLYTILCLGLTLIFALFACSCAMTQPLTFNKNYLGDVKDNYYEKLEYSVEYKSSYQDIVNATTYANEDIPTFNGTYVVEFSDHTITELESDINFDEQSYHHLKSTLSLDITFKDGTVLNDKIVSEVYFYSKDWALAPIYSMSTMKTSFLTLGAETKYEQMIYQYSVLYNKDSYNISKKYYSADENENINLIDITDTDPNSPSYFDTTKLTALSGDGKTVEYDIKTIIDNAQLLFAIRNSELSAKLPTVSFTYETPIELVATAENEANYTINQLTYNGEDKSNTSMPITIVELYINSSNNRGVTKYLNIQKEEVNGIKNNALMVEYAEPVLSGLTSLGALVYKLNKVTIGK